MTKLPATPTWRFVRSRHNAPTMRHCALLQKAQGTLLARTAVQRKSGRGVCALRHACYFPRSGRHSCTSRKLPSDLRDSSRNASFRKGRHELGIHQLRCGPVRGSDFCWARKQLVSRQGSEQARIQHSQENRSIRLAGESA